MRWNSDSALKILNALDTALKEKKWTRAHIATLCGLRSPATVQAHLNKLAEGGLVTLSGREKPVITPKGTLMLAAWREVRRRKPDEVG